MVDDVLVGFRFLMVSFIGAQRIDCFVGSQRIDIHDWNCSGHSAWCFGVPTLTLWENAQGEVDLPIGWFWASDHLSFLVTSSLPMWNMIMNGCSAREFLVHTKPVFSFLPKQQLAPLILNWLYTFSAPPTGQSPRSKRITTVQQFLFLPMLSSSKLDASEDWVILVMRVICPTMNMYFTGNLFVFFHIIVCCRWCRSFFHSPLHLFQSIRPRVGGQSSANVRYQILQQTAKQSLQIHAYHKKKSLFRHILTHFS